MLQERALIALRRQHVDAAMTDLAQARKLFAEGGLRRQEALTLHRIAHAALDEGNVELASERAQEASALAEAIHHARVVALCQELQARICWRRGDMRAAAKLDGPPCRRYAKQGDQIGAMYAAQGLIQAQLSLGNLDIVLKLTRRLRAEAASSKLRDLTRLRAPAP